MYLINAITKCSILNVTVNVGYMYIGLGLLT